MIIMDEIVTKENLNTYTEGLKGVLNTYSQNIKNYIDSQTGGKFSEVITVSGTQVIQELQPNIIYSFGTMDSLTVALGTPDEDSNDYAFEFTSGTNATNLSVPSSIIWDNQININPNKYYIVLIHYSNSEYYGTIKEWNTTNIDNRVTLIYSPSSSLQTTQIYYSYRQGSSNNQYGTDVRDDFVAKMWIDGRQLDHPCPYYPFEDTNEHVVQLEFINPKTIPPYAFKDSSTIREINIPNSAIAIGYYAFAGSINNLRKVSGGVNLVNIGSGNDKLYDTSLYGDELYIYLGPTFVGANGTIPENTSYTLRPQTTLISDNAFKQQTGLTGITFQNGNNNLTVNQYAFSETGLVSLEANKLSTGQYAFSSCTNLASVELNSCSIGSYAFNGCTDLTSVELSGCSIATYAFKGCTNLNSVKLTGSQLTQYTFQNCSKITSIEMDDHVTYSGNSSYAFNISSNFTLRINIRSILYHLNSNYCTKNSYIFSGGVSGNVKLYQDNQLITQVSIPNTVSNIPDYAFRNCTDITSVTIPSSVTSIGLYAFSNTSLSGSLTIPSSVTSIGTYAFYNSDLTAVTISGTTSIGQGAFQSCTNLSSISIPSTCYNVYKDSFESTAWWNNKSDGIIKINSLVLGHKGTSPTSLSYTSSSYKAIANSAYQYNSTITSLTLGSYIKYIGSSAFYNCTGITTASLTLTGLEEIGGSAFYSCSNMNVTSLTLTAIKKIGSYAFSNVTNLQTVTIGGQITDIGYRAFYQISNLTVTINATTPPTISSPFTTTGLTIKVPSNMVDTYKAASGWRSYASYIVSQ